MHQGQVPASIAGGWQQKHACSAALTHAASILTKMLEAVRVAGGEKEYDEQNSYFIICDNCSSPCHLCCAYLNSAEAGALSAE